MIRFPEPAAQADYESLLASGMDKGDAHERVERDRLMGAYIPKDQRLKPKPFYIVGSDDQKRIARLAHVKDMAENDPDKYDQYVRQAKAAGVSIAGKGYSSGIAAYPGDPDAWYKDDSDLAAKAKLKGGHVGKEDGLMKIQMPMDPSKKSHRQMLDKPRIHKPTVKHRRNIERKIRNK